VPDSGADHATRVIHSNWLIQLENKSFHPLEQAIREHCLASLNLPFFSQIFQRSEAYPFLFPPGSLGAGWTWIRPAGSCTQAEPELQYVLVRWACEWLLYRPFAVGQRGKKFTFSARFPVNHSLSVWLKTWFLGTPSLHRSFPERTHVLPRSPLALARELGQSWWYLISPPCPRFSCSNGKKLLAQSCSDLFGNNLPYRESWPPHGGSIKLSLVAGQGRVAIVSQCLALCAEQQVPTALCQVPFLHIVFMLNPKQPLGWKLISFFKGDLIQSPSFALAQAPRINAGRTVRVFNVGSTGCPMAPVELAQSCWRSRMSKALWLQLSLPCASWPWETEEQMCSAGIFLLKYLCCLMHILWTQGCDAQSTLSYWGRYGGHHQLSSPFAYNSVFVFLSSGQFFKRAWYDYLESLLSFAFSVMLLQPE